MLVYFTILSQQRLNFPALELEKQLYKQFDPVKSDNLADRMLTSGKF